jgi:hypothetical protein
MILVSLIEYEAAQSAASYSIFLLKLVKRSHFRGSLLQTIWDCYILDIHFMVLALVKLNWD